jgi:uncharacterized protein
LAVQDDNPAVARVLLDHGAKPGGIESGGSTALMTAADKNDAEMIRLLLGHGADVEERGVDSDSPLMVAVEDRDVDAVKALIEGGASCENENVPGTSVRELARPADNDDTPDLVSRQKEILHILKTNCTQ